MKDNLILRFLNLNYYLSRFQAIPSELLDRNGSEIDFLPYAFIRLC